MRKVLGQPAISPDGKFRITLFDDKLIRRERICTGKILELNLDSPQMDENGNTYYVTTVQADVDDKVHVGEAIIWDHQIRSNKLSPGIYAEGATVGLAIEIKSKHAGRTRVELLPIENFKKLKPNNSSEMSNSLEEKKRGLIDQIEKGMAFNIQELFKKEKDLLDDPVMGPMMLMDNMNTSIAEYKESLVRRRNDLSLTLDEIDIITKTAYTRIYDEVFDS